MRKQKMLALATFALVTMGWAPANALAAEQEERGVQQATLEFYSALNAMFQGDAGPMEAVWSHEDDVTYMGPDGKFIVGWNELLPIWKGVADMKLGGMVQPEQVQYTIGQDLATVQCVEAGENVVDGKPVKVGLRATNVFRKENGQWKMIGHHTDKLPFLEQ